VQPAASGRLLGQLPVAPVAAHQERRATADLADLAARQLFVFFVDDPHLDL
jgi:hypothetical protein